MYTPCSISHLITSLPPHFTLHHSTSNPISDIIPNHSTFHVGPFLNISYRSDQHLLQRTIPLHNTIFQIAPSRSHASHPALALHPRVATLMYHTTPHSMYSTPHQFRITPYIGHIIYASHWPHFVSPHFTQHCTASDCTPNSTSHYHVSHNIPHHTSAHHHCLHPTTCTVSHNTTTTYLPHSTSHNVPHSMPQHTPVHIAPPLSRHNPIPV